MPWFRQLEHTFGRTDLIFAFERQRQRSGRLAADEPDREGDLHRPFVRLPRGGRHILSQLKCQFSGLCVVLGFAADFRRPGLRIPQPELIELAPRYIFKAADEIFHRCGLAVMPLEIQVHAFAEYRRRYDRAQHADHFGTFFVHGRRVEVIYRDVGLRLHRVSKRSGIFLELPQTQIFYISNAPHGM